MTRHGIVYPAQSLTSICTLLLYGLLMEDSAHVGPFTKLGLRLGESLDSYSKTILVPSSTFRSVLDLGRGWRNEVRIFAANIKEARAFAVLMRVWLSLVLSVPLSTPGLQFCRGLSELVHTVRSSEDNSRSNQRASALVEVHCLWLTSICTLLLYRLLMEDSAHVGPFTKLRLRLCESLDSYSKTILVPSSTFRSVLDLGRWWRNE